MRRFSQRNSLVTLSDINITPLLDLAFVLLIIFVIISPSIRSKQEHGMQLNLPAGGGPEQLVDAKDLRLVEVSPEGVYMLDRKRIGTGQTSVDRIIKELMAFKRTNPKVVVNIRVDKKGFNEHTLAMVNACQQHDLTRVYFATDPAAAK